MAELIFGDFVTVVISEPPLDRVARLPASAVNAAGEVLVIDADECVDCGTCAEVCPVDAPIPEEDA